MKRSRMPAKGRRLAVVAGLRSPFVKAGTTLARAPAAFLGAAVVRELLARAEWPPEAVDEVIMGCVGPGAGEANVARVIALRSGIPPSVPAATVQRNCASGFEALTTAAERVACGRGDVFVVGGVESMSSYPVLFPPAMGAFLARFARARTLRARAAALLSLRPSHFKPNPSLVLGLTDPVAGLLMGQTAERLAWEFHVSRERQDAYALSSHLRAARARASGRLAREIAPVMAPPDFAAVACEDNGIRDGLDMGGLARLPAFFEREVGTVTVGNSSQVTDGACALLVMSEARAAAEGIEPLGFLAAHDYAGVGPSRMGLGPVLATARVLRRAGMELSQMELVEINEAFAAQVLACMEAFASDDFARRELGRGGALGDLDPERLNPNGGAVALGHPLGASGARLALTLLLEMRQRGLRHGLAALCVGGGQGGALLLEAAA